MSRTDLFTGTVKGCGTGTMVIIGDENDETRPGGTAAANRTRLRNGRPTERSR